MRYAYLVFVDAIKNHNKFYEITENDDKSIDVKYGRVGDAVRTHHYSPWEKRFDELKTSKEWKGYKDETSLHSYVAQTNNTDKDFAPVNIKEINDFINELINESREFMKKNYTVKATDVTQKMVDEAEADLEELCYIAENSLNALPAFNQKLLDLYSDIPRRMAKVADSLAKTSADFDRIIKREQDMLDNIKGQIIAVSKTADVKDNQTALEAYGLQVEPISYKEEDKIIAHLGYDYGNNSKGQRKAMEDRYITAYKVENNETRAKYEDFKKQYNISSKDVKLFYHGSRTENWWSIMKTGLSLHPNAVITGKMFGNGLYFASDFRKSANYSSASGSYWTNGNSDCGYVAILAVGLGKCYKPTGSLSSKFDKSDLPSGCLSVYADKKLTGLQNDEYVVYRQEQCTIKYLVKIAGGNAREKEFNLDRNAIRDSIAKGINEIVKESDCFRVELKLDAMNDKCKNEILEKICYDYDAERLFIDYDPSKDTIEINAITSKGKDVTIHNLTKDDYAFLSREMKKCFADNEVEWKKFSKSFNKEKVGTVKECKQTEKAKER